jgi:Ran GTPase-activating protein (RanGAP) involved in mRNA processing and transport
VNSAMEPEPEDEEQAAAAATAEAPCESTAAAAGVDVAGHEVSASSTALDASDWGLTAAQVREVAGALPQLQCLRELVLDGVPVSGTTPRRGDFRRVVEAVDADLGMFRALCEALRALQGLTSLSLGGCYLGPQALAVLAQVVFRDATAAVKKVVLSKNFLFGSKMQYDTFGETVHDVDADQTGWSALCDALPGSPLEELIVADIGMGVTGVTSLAKAISSMAALVSLNFADNRITDWDRDLSGLVALSEAIVLSKTLKSIDLSDCGIKVKGVTEVAKFISAGAALASLTLDQNGIFGELYSWVECKEADKYVEESTPLFDAIKMSNLTSLSLINTGMGSKVCSRLATSLSAAINSLALGSNPIGDGAVVQLLDGLKDVSLTSLDISKTNSGVSTATKLAELLAEETRFKAAIEKVNVSGCIVTPEAVAQLLTAANEVSRARLRAHQVLTFSEALHARLGSECLLQAVALDTDVWRRVAENIRERHGHELMCSQLAQAGQTWFEVTVEGIPH